MGQGKRVTALFAALTACAVCAAQETADVAHSGAFAVSGLRCVIGDNAAAEPHRAGYNGVFAISAPDQDESPFVPLYAGLNLEHYFDARPRSPEANKFFEPRHAVMTFTRVDATTAELHQPQTPFYGVESWTRFEVKEPYYIDMHFRCVPHKEVFEGGFLGVFWASYINAPLDKSMYMRGTGPVTDRTIWVQHCTPLHDHDSTVRHVGDNLELPFEEAGKMLYASFSPLRFADPFFYGRFRDRVLIYIFQPGPIIRFAHSPSGGGATPDNSDTNPAWDFQLLVPKPEVGREYGLRMRLVYKPWVDRDDVLAEVRRYLEEAP